MKMEAAVYAETPNRLRKTIVLNKICNMTVYWLVTLFCSQAACTGSQSWKTFKLSRMRIYFTSFLQANSAVVP